MRTDIFDVVVVGGGLGGLACATFLAKQGLKVGVFEQHYVPGGYCHSFRRGPYVFDAAVEYIGCCGPGQDVWNALKLLGAERFVTFDEMYPDGFDELIFPRHRVAICKKFAAYRERLESLFPRERKGLQEYGAVLEGIWREIHVWGVGIFLWRFKRFPSACQMLQRSAGKTLRDLLDSTIRSRELRAILSGQSGNYALPPSKADLIVHAITVMHFHEGAYYPHGGVQELSNALAAALKRHGGQLFLRRAVRSIHLERGRVAGIELESGEHVRARIVVSNADPQTTLLHLVNGHAGHARLGPGARDVEYSLSSFQVYLGTDLNLVKLGLRAANYWLCPSYDFEKLYKLLFNGDVPPKTYMLVSAMSIKDSSTRLAPPGFHVLKILTPISYRRFREWDQMRLGRRGKQYKELKERFADQLIVQAETLIPGLRDHITCRVIGTPLTNLAYTRSPEGAMYGLARTPQQSGPSGFSPVSSVPGLYFTGTNVYYPGVLGALGSGIMSGIVILRHSNGLKNPQTVVTQGSRHTTEAIR